VKIQLNGEFNMKKLYLRRRIFGREYTRSKTIFTSKDKKIIEI